MTEATPNTTAAAPTKARRLIKNITEGNLLEIAYKVVNLLTAPLFGLFFMAMFVRWASTAGRGTSTSRTAPRASRSFSIPASTRSRTTEGSTRLRPISSSVRRL